MFFFPCIFSAFLFSWLWGIAGLAACLWVKSTVSWPSTSPTSRYSQRTYFFSHATLLNPMIVRQTDFFLTIFVGKWHTFVLIIMEKKDISSWKWYTRYYYMARLFTAPGDIILATSQSWSMIENHEHKWSSVLELPWAMPVIAWFLCFHLLTWFGLRQAWLWKRLAWHCVGCQAGKHKCRYWAIPTDFTALYCKKEMIVIHIACYLKVEAEGSNFIQENMRLCRSDSICLYSFWHFHMWMT